MGAVSDLFGTTVPLGSLPGPALRTGPIPVALDDGESTLERIQRAAESAQQRDIPFGQSPLTDASGLAVRGVDAAAGATSRGQGLLLGALGTVGLGDNPLRGVRGGLPPVDVKYPEHVRALQNKYTKLAPVVSQLSGAQRTGLFDFDAKRVSRGASPLTERQTLAAIQTLLSGEPATPNPDRSPLKVLDNIRSDLGDIVKTIPRLPLGLWQELADLPKFPLEVAKNRQAGLNSVASVLQAPGVRMIPGAYVLGNLAQGTSGIRELATHPLFTGLDLLPGASKLAEGTPVARAARELTDPTGRRPRPIRAVFMDTVTRDPLTGGILRDETTGLPVMGRTRLGQASDYFRDETRLGQALDKFGGKRNRMAARARFDLENRARGVLGGWINPVTDAEGLARSANLFLDRWSKEFPELARDRGDNVTEAARDLFNQVQRDPSVYPPEFVTQLRTLSYQFANHLESEGKLGFFRDEWYDMKEATELLKREGKVGHHERMLGLLPYVTNASGLTRETLLTAIPDLIKAKSKSQKLQTIDTLNAVLDAAGYDLRPFGLHNARSKFRDRKMTFEQYLTNARGMVSENQPSRVAATMEDVVRMSRDPRFRNDQQFGRLRAAVALGGRSEITKALKALSKRKPPAMSEAEFAAVSTEWRALADRMALSKDLSSQFSEKKLAQAQKNFEAYQAKTPPARFMPLLEDLKHENAAKAIHERAEQVLARDLTPDEASQIVLNEAHRVWSGMPGVDADTATAMAKQAEADAKRMWQILRDEGADPVFVHHVSPGRANQVRTVNVGPVQFTESQTKGRTLDMSSGVQDLQVSILHQASEILQREANGRYLDSIIEDHGITEAALREKYIDEARRRAIIDPDLDVEGHLDRIIKRGYDHFNPHEAGLNWGGVHLRKYDQSSFYIPKALAENLGDTMRPPSLVSSVIDPITKAFRFNVIGLGTGVIVNNFFSNSVALGLESGLGPLKYFKQAREYLKHPEKMANELSDELIGIVMAEHDAKQYMRASWLKSRPGEKLRGAKFMSGFNAAHAFRESAIAEGARRGMDALTSVADKSMRLQQLGDNVYRLMQYMYERDKKLAKGASLTEADRVAVEAVRRTLVDYGSFTKIERAAMRQVIPFYSYMSHAARFIMRYPFDHPLRADMVARIADSERERLGTLPGGYMSFVPVPDWVPVLGGGDESKMNVFTTRLFDPFGDVSDLLSLSGWMSAMNPVIQTALQKVGVRQGQQDLYPTMRYNPDTGQMEAVNPGLGTLLLNNALPRVGLLTAVTGLNPEFNELRATAPDAAARRLVSLAGLPRLWRSVSPVQDIISAENARSQTANNVLRDALRSGDWSEALRYPTLRTAYAELAQLSQNDPQLLERLSAADPGVLRELIERTG